MRLEDLENELCPVCGQISLRHVAGQTEGAEWSGVVCDEGCDLGDNQ